MSKYTVVLSNKDREGLEAIVSKGSEKQGHNPSKSIAVASDSISHTQVRRILKKRGQATFKKIKTDLNKLVY